MRLSKDGYYKNKHSCFLLQYHMVLVTKYRKKVISGDLEEYLKKYTLQYFLDRDMPVSAMECMPDHMHIMFDAPPQINIAGFVNAFKSASSRQVRKHFIKELEPYYWKPYFWSLSYFIGTVSQKTTNVVKNYIENQKKS